MKIQKIRWKNFLSTGNYFIEFDITNSNTTLFSGKNGSGKSTFLDALTFSLFGKSFRRNNIPQLINSINGKDCIVEIEFNMGKNDFKIVRGIKPKLFEIYKNGVLIPQDSKSKDYQRILEEQILKMTYKSFCQVVILGSSAYTPFMQLSAADRRSVVENLLDIDVFSSMNSLLKIKLSETRENLNTTDHKIELLKEKTSNQQKIIKTIESKSKDSLETYNNEIENTKKQIKENKDDLNTIQNELDVLVGTILDENQQSEELKSLETEERDIKKDIRNIDTNINFYEKNDTCPSCSQKIETQHKEKIIKETEDAKNELAVKTSTLHDKITTVETRIEEINKTTNDINAIEKKILEKKNNISAASKYIRTLSDKMSAMLEKTDESIDETEKLHDFISEANEQIEIRKELVNDMHYYNIGSTILKDTGIKSKIIKHYLPIMNKLINKYLSVMNFFCQFTLDENFNETIKSRHRDEFTYHSFSEGERLRIDLSLLLAWREIARAKNSVNCNILVLDEVFDSSLDAMGTEEFLTILQGMGKKANVFVISHKSDTMTDKFDRHVMFEKKNNFTKIKP